MKKLLSLMLLLMAAVITTATFTACGDDDDDNKTASVAGTYTGKDMLSFSVMGMDLKQPNTADVNYVINQNNDGSISVVIPEETFDFTAVKMGSIVQGTYSVTNIPYDKAKNAYYKKNYTVTEGKITVSFSGNKVTVVNVHKFGSMPMDMTGTFVGTRK